MACSLALSVMSEPWNIRLGAQQEKLAYQGCLHFRHVKRAHFTGLEFCPSPTFLTMSSYDTHHSDFERGLSRRTTMTVHESQPAQEASSMTGRKTNTIISYLVAELDRDAWMGAMSATPIICFCISGLIDAVAFNTWGCFVGMQTGNLTMLHIGANR